MARTKQPKPIDVRKTGPVGLSGIRNEDLYNNWMARAQQGDQDAINILNAFAPRPTAGSINPQSFFTPQQVPYNSPWEEQGRSVYDKPVIFGDDPSVINENRAASQSGLLQLINGATKGIITAGTTFLDSTLGLIWGIGQGLYNLGDNNSETGFWNGMWQNDFNVAMSQIQEGMEEALPNYYSSYEQEAPWYNNIMSANFWGDKVLKNMGFTIGALGAAVATGGVGTGVGLGVNAGIRGLAGIARGVGAGMHTTASILKGGRVAGQAANYLTRMAISANGEAAIEAINAVKDEQKLLDTNLENRRYELISQLDPSDPSYYYQVKQINDAVNSYKESMKSELRDIGNSVYGANMAILSLTNSLEFGRLLSGGFKNTAKLSAHSFTANGEKVSSKEAFRRMLAGDNIQAVNDVSKGFGKTAGLTVKNMLSEGFEEAAQNVASNSNQMQGTARLNKIAESTILGSRINPEATDELVDYSKAFIKTISDQFGGFEKPGWEEFFLGALTGGMGTPMIKSVKQTDSEGKDIIDPKTNKPINKLKIRMGGGIWEAREAINQEYQQNQELVDAINKKFQDPEFINRSRHAVSQIDFNKRMKDALQNNDILEFKNSEIGKLVEDVFFFRNAGMIDEYKAMYEGFTNIDDKTLQQIYTATMDSQGNTELSKEETEKVRKTYENKAKSNLEKINKIQDYYDFVEERFRDYSKEFKEELAYKYVQLDDTVKRIKELEDKKNRNIGSFKLGMLRTADALFQRSDSLESGLGLTEEYLDDNLIQLSPQEEQDLKDLKAQKKTLQKVIKHWEKDSRKADATLNFVMNKHLASRAAQDSKKIQEDIKNASSLEEVEAIIQNTMINAQFGKLSDDQWNRVWQELIYSKDRDVATKVAQWYYAHTTKQEAVKMLDRLEWDEEAKDAVGNVFTKIWQESKLGINDVLNNLQQFKNELDAILKGEALTSNLFQKYFGEDISVWHKDFPKDLSNILDSTIKKIKMAKLDYGAWELQWSLQGTQNNQQQGQSNQGGNQGGQNNQINNPSLHYLTKDDSPVKNSSVFNKIPVQEVANMLDAVLQNQGIDPELAEDSDRYNAINDIITAAMDQNIRNKWLSNPSSTKHFVAQAVDQYLNGGQSNTYQNTLNQVLQNINNATSIQQLDQIYNDAINSGIKEEDIKDVYNSKKNQLTSSNKYNPTEQYLEDMLNDYLNILGEDINNPSISINEQKNIVDTFVRVINKINSKDELTQEEIPYANIVYARMPHLLEDNIIDDSNVQPETLNRLPNTMTTTLTPYVIGSNNEEGLGIHLGLKNGVLIFNSTNGFIGSFYQNFDRADLGSVQALDEGFNNALKVQRTIDNKLHLLKKQPIHYIVHHNGNVMYAAIPYTKEVKDIVEEGYGHVVIDQNNKEFLIIGALGYQRGDNQGKTDWEEKKASLLQESSGFNGYYSSNDSTIITNIGEGRFIDVIQGQDLSRDVLDLLNSSLTNPRGLTIRQLKWGIVYPDGIHTVNVNPSKDTIHTAKPIVTSQNNLGGDLGKVYLYIPTADGAYYRHEVKPLMFNEIRDGKLKQDLLNSIDKIVKDHKVEAVFALKDALVLDEDFYINFNSATPLITYTPKGGVKTSEYLPQDQTQAILRLRDILSSINPRISVTPYALESKSQIEDLSEAGALELRSAVVLGTMGANFNIALNPEILQPIGNRGQAIGGNAFVNTTQTLYFNNREIVYDGTSFKENGSIITNPETLSNLRDILDIRDGKYQLEHLYDFSSRKPKIYEGQYCFITDSTGTRAFHQDQDGNYSRQALTRELEELRDRSREYIQKLKNQANSPQSDDDFEGQEMNIPGLWEDEEFNGTPMNIPGLWDNTEQDDTEGVEMNIPGLWDNEQQQANLIETSINNVANGLREAVSNISEDIKKQNAINALNQWQSSGILNQIADNLLKTNRDATIEDFINAISNETSNAAAKTLIERFKQYQETCNSLQNIIDNTLLKYPKSAGTTLFISGNNSNFAAMLSDPSQDYLLDLTSYLEELKDDGRDIPLDLDEATVSDLLQFFDSKGITYDNINNREDFDSLLERLNCKL